MNLPIQVTYALASWVVKGLQDGTLERVGGVIQEVISKKIVTLLRDSFSDVLRDSFSDVNQRLDGVENQIDSLGQTLQGSQSILQVSTAASILNLGVSVMGFAVIAQRLNEIENQLKQAQELLNKINRKIDMSFYANFRAGVELAINAFTMTKIENRRSSALQAINRFLEAEHIYKDYTVNELSQKSQIIDKYILTLSLAYIAEARCYLELEEHETAIRRFQEGTKVISLLVNQYIEIMLTSNPAVYLHPEFQGQIDLKRLAKIYQWINSDLDENAVFENQRKNLFKIAKDHTQWIDSLPPAILDRIEVQGGWFGPNHDELKQAAFQRLPQVFEVMESMIETNNRFESYQTEIQAISQLGISFHEWLQLKPSTETKPESAELMFIIPSQPLELPG
jgi:tetratricopeptide (TPR) repeat protein